MASSNILYMNVIGTNRNIIIIGCVVQFGSIGRRGANMQIHVEQITRRMKKISKNRQSFLARKAMHIYKSTVLFLPILGYFCLFLPICESVANLHESTLLFALNIHAYFCLFFVI